MVKPHIAQKEPYGIDLEPGEYWWCKCGRSVNQPYCDGSHKNTEFEPIKVTITEVNKYWLCGCKHSGNPPFCDGTHNRLS